MITQAGPMAMIELNNNNMQNSKKEGQFVL